jgi:hypothetical protein
MLQNGAAPAVAMNPFTAGAPGSIPVSNAQNPFLKGLLGQA